MGRHAIDLTGRRFGQLVVIGRSGAARLGRHALWVCRCDCGNAHIARGTNLLKPRGGPGRCQACFTLRRELGAGVTVVQLWGYANCEEGAFAVAVNGLGEAVVHTHWSHKHQKMAMLSENILVRKCMALAAEGGHIRAQKPRESVRHWMDSLGIAAENHSFTPRQRLHERWLQVSGEWRGDEDGLAPPAGSQVGSSVNFVSA